MDFVADSNILINVNRYLPRDIYPSVWTAIEADLIGATRLVIPREVCEELERVDDGLSPWAKRMPGFVDQPTDEDIDMVADIATNHPDWVSGHQNAADPWVIAHAYRHGAVVLTHEKAAGPTVSDAKLKIPNVAAEYGIQCIDFNELGRREGWRF